MKEERNNRTKNKKISKIIIFFIILFVINIISSNSLCFAKEENEKIKNSSQGYFKLLKPNFIIDGYPIKLKDGRILVTGNRYSGNLIFDPKTNKFSKTSMPTNPLIIHKGCVLDNGKVLFVGAYTEDPVDKFTQIYNQIFADIEKKEISLTALNRPQGMSIPEYRHIQHKEAMKKYKALTKAEKEKLYMQYLEQSPELLKEYNEYKKEYEDSMYGQIYNPYEDTWEVTTGKINIRRSGQQLVLLNDGKVLIVDASAERKINLHERVSRIEIYNPITGIFELKRSTKVFDRLLLSDMRVMEDNRVFMLFHNGCYMYYNPITDTYSDVKKLPCIVNKHIFLKDGRLLLFEGVDRNEFDNIRGISIFDINTEEYKKTGNLAVDRIGKAAFMCTPVELSDGNILILGGVKKIEKITFPAEKVEIVNDNSAEIYNPKTELSRKINNMNKARINSNAILLDDGRVLIFDRKNGVELYIPSDKKK